MAHSRGASMRRWFAVPRGETAARLTLLGLVIVLQDLLELPRPAFPSAPGKQLLGIGVFLTLAVSLALLLVATRPQLPAWRALRSRRVQAVVLLLTLAACPTGLMQIGRMATVAFAPPFYPNDGTTLDHYAAQQLLEGHNPYVTTDIVAAIRLYGQDPGHTTALGQGAFASLFPLHYPDGQMLRQVFATEPAGHPGDVQEFESHLSYPALAFLPLVPLVWAGLQTVTPFYVLCLLLLVLLLVLAVPVELRLWVLLLAVADAPLLDATVGGVLDVFYILLLVAACRWWRRPLISTLFLGLAIAAKQIGWFFLPFYALLVWRERGWREALARLGGAGAIFAVFNAPFFLNNPRAWVTGLLAPESSFMFPSGTGLIRLSLSGVLPLFPESFYTVLELLALAACIWWYWRYGEGRPEIALVLAVLPLFLAWRSLTTYFYFLALPAVVLVIASERRQQTRAAGGEGGYPPLPPAAAETSGDQAVALPKRWYLQRRGLPGSMLPQGRR